MLRFALKENGIEDFEIVVGENGKPFLKSGEMLFNISHCAEGVAVVIDTVPVGIDVQEIGGFNEKVAKRFFNESENKKINASPDKAKAFTRIWTLKESAIKCEGKSLADLGEFSFGDYENFFEKYKSATKSEKMEMAKKAVRVRRGPLRNSSQVSGCSSSRRPAMSPTGRENTRD